MKRCLKKCLRRQKGKLDECDEEILSGAFELELPNHRAIFVCSDIDADLGTRVYAETVQLLNDGDEPINYIINTAGGDIDQGLIPIIESMRMARESVEVWTYCLGAAYSGGAVALATGDIGCRVISPLSRCLIHNIQISGSHNDFTKDFPYVLENWESTADTIREVLTFEIGKKFKASRGYYVGPSTREKARIEKKIEGLYQAGSKVLDATATVKLGLADCISYLKPTQYELVEFSLEMNEEDSNGCKSNDLGEED